MDVKKVGMWISSTGNQYLVTRFANSGARFIKWWYLHPKFLWNV